MDGLENLVGAPAITPETAAFWDAANEKRLLYAQCLKCDRPHFYPRRICPFCFSDQIDWKEACGTGTLYAFSFYRKGRPPYISAWVTLDEGVSLMTNLISCEVETLAIGDKMKVVFRPAETGQLVPLFTPA